MNGYDCLRAVSAALIVITAALGVPAFAAGDVMYPSAAHAMINGSSVPVSSAFTTRANGHTTLDHAVYAGDWVAVTTTWIIRRSSGSGAGSSIGHVPDGGTVDFIVTPSASNPGRLPVTVAETSCTDSMPNQTTCTVEINFNVPAAIGGYAIEIAAVGLAAESGSGTVLIGRRHMINFSAELFDETLQPKETRLTVDPKCVLYNGDVDLTATLEELAEGARIGVADINYAVDASLIRSAITGANGIAAQSYNVTGLGAGDHTLYAEFDGSFDYLKSNTTDTLGISYLFMGFGQPINGDGTSIFSGPVIPVKIRLVDAYGLPVTDAEPKVWLVRYDTVENVGGELKPVSSMPASDSGNIMRYVPEDEQYVYNWGTIDLENGVYAVVVALGDSPTCRASNPYAVITVAKKEWEAAKRH
ncbi:MAG TPA: PxKF domain-containing protein [Nitrosomonas halophila]|nr:PxKF domain-containing protein [Nitrosomonas halophila]